LPSIPFCRPSLLVCTCRRESIDWWHLGTKLESDAALVDHLCVGLDTLSAVCTLMTRVRSVLRPFSRVMEGSWRVSPLLFGCLFCVILRVGRESGYRPSLLKLSRGAELGRPSTIQLEFPWAVRCPWLNSLMHAACL